MNIYDEDLQNNPFYVYVKNKFESLFRQCAREKWILCVPCRDSFAFMERRDVTHEDVLGHVLVPEEKKQADSEEQTSCHFRTLTDCHVFVSGKTIELVHDYGKATSEILFKESVYLDIEVEDSHPSTSSLCTDNETTSLCVSVWCIASSLSNDTAAILDETGQPLRSITTCIQFLKDLNGGNSLEKLDACLNQFIKRNSPSSFTSISALKCSLQVLIERCKSCLQKATDIRTFTGLRKQNVSIALESYVLYNLYSVVLFVLAGFTCDDDAQFNRSHHRLLAAGGHWCEVPADVIVAARLEFLRLEMLKTPMEKLDCLYRVAQRVTTSYTERGCVVSSEDILTALIHLILKHPSPRWYAELAYIKELSLSGTTSDMDERAYYLASLEASLEHIKSRRPLLTMSEYPFREPLCDDQDPHTQFKVAWKAVVDGRPGELVQAIEDGKHCTLEALNRLCHPLCDCDKCEVVCPQIQDLTQVKDGRGMNLLHLAAAVGSVNCLEPLLKSGRPAADVNAVDSKGFTPLHHAAQFGHQNAVLMLLHSGADASLEDFEGRLPLHLAAVFGYENCVKAMLYYSEHSGPVLDVNHQDVFGYTALHHATKWGYFPIVRILLEYQADPFVKSKRNESANDLAHNIHIERLLQRRGELTPSASLPSLVTVIPRSNTANSSGLSGRLTLPDVLSDAHTNFSQYEKEMRTKCFKAIGVGDVPLACYYLGISAIPGGCHPLCECVQCKPEEEGGRKKAKPDISIDSSNEEGYTALHMAILCNVVELIPLLLSHGANPNAPTLGGMTPLHLACQCNLIEIVNELLVHPVNVTAQDKFRNTALHYAVIMGSEPLVNALLSCSRIKTCLKATNSNNRTPRQEALARKHTAIVAIIRKFECDT